MTCTATYCDQSDVPQIDRSHSPSHCPVPKVCSECGRIKDADE